MLLILWLLASSARRTPSNTHSALSYRFDGYRKQTSEHCSSIHGDYDPSASVYGLGIGHFK